MAVTATPRCGTLVTSLLPSSAVLRCQGHALSAGHHTFRALKQPRPKSLEEFQVSTEPLGRGACSVVFAAKHRSTKYDVAIKAMSRTMPHETGALPVAQGIENESHVFNHLLGRGLSPHVVELIGCFKGSSDEAKVLGIELPNHQEAEPIHYFVTELLGGGSLDQVVQDGPVEEDRAKTLFRKICEGLLSLHLEGVVHRDLKPGNVFFNSEAEPKLIDFSHAALAAEGEESLHGELGTRGYVAPEVLAEKPYSSKCDIFSLGCLLHTLLSGKPPRRDMRIGMLLHLPSAVSPEARRFLSSLLSMDPTSRPTAKEVLKEPWLQE